MSHHTTERLYHLVAVNDAAQRRDVLTSTPETHDACMPFSITAAPLRQHRPSPPAGTLDAGGRLASA
jgi:hypothetical protein